MIALDTNVLVRIVTRDDNAMAQKAAAFIRENCSPAAPGFISLTALTELVWVLASAYLYKKSDIADSLWSFLNAEIFIVQHHEIALAALRDFLNGKADFADYLIQHGALEAGAKYVVTFDKIAGKEKGFFLLK